MHKSQEPVQALNVLTDDPLIFPISELRQTLMLNLFKRELLGEEHLPGQAQTAEIKATFAARGLERLLDWRRWDSWFNKEEPTQMYRSSVDELDRYLDAERDPDRYLQTPGATPATQFHLDLCYGGLAARLLVRTTSKTPRAVLAERAASYKFWSPWHLHTDAIEAVALAQANGDVTWEEVKAYAARRVLQGLHDRWGLRGGTVFRQLPSALALSWGSASTKERTTIRRRYARMSRSLFDAHMTLPAEPDWRLIDLDADLPSEQVHRLLFGLANDAAFLVGPRLEAWSLDLVSAGLAVHALAWTDRFATHGFKVQPELIFWRAVELGFLVDGQADERADALAHALDLVGVRWSDEVEALLQRARDHYRSAMKKLDLRPELAFELAAHCRRQHPVVYCSRPSRRAA